LGLDDYYTKAFVAVEGKLLYAVVPNYKGLLEKAEAGALELVAELERNGCKLVESELKEGRAFFGFLCPGVHLTLAYIKCTEYGCGKRLVPAFPPLQKLQTSNYTPNGVVLWR